MMKLKASFKIIQQDLERCRDQNKHWHFSNLSQDQLALFASVLANILKELLALDQTVHISCALQGELGSGKTTLCQLLIPCLSQNHFEQIESPTFAYVHPYTMSATQQIWHFDLYRLKSKEHFYQMDFDRFWQEPGISLIEWPQIIQADLPLPYFLLQLNYSANSQMRDLDLFWQTTNSVNEKANHD